MPALLQKTKTAILRCSAGMLPTHAGAWRCLVNASQVASRSGRATYQHIPLEQPVSRPQFTLATFSVVALLGACARQPVTAFADRTPKFDVAAFYSGHSRGYGFVFSRSGNVVKQFTADEDGTWNGQQLNLHEHYVYADGKTQDRDWIYTRNPGGTWTGRTPEVIGVATGTTSGNAFHMTYRFDLTKSGSDHTLDFDDWQWMVAPKIMMNRAWGSKFGVDFAEIQATFIHD
jgi:hypothetical protein